MSDEQLRVSMPIWVPKADEFANYQEIRNRLNAYLRSNAERLNLDDLGGWRLTANIESRRANSIGIFKKLSRYPSDREYVVNIGLPLPFSDEVQYGLDRALQVIFIDHDAKNFRSIEPNFSSYSSLDEYIYEASIRAIDEAFSVGFTVNGKKIRYQR